MNSDLVLVAPSSDDHKVSLHEPEELLSDVIFTERVLERQEELVGLADQFEAIVVMSSPALKT